MLFELVALWWTLTFEEYRVFESHAQAERHVRKVLAEDGFRAVGRARMTTSDYAINSVAASMRLLVLASSLRDAVEDATMQMLHHIASTKGLGVDALVRIVSEHEQAVDALNPDADQCLMVDVIFPKFW